MHFDREFDIVLHRFPVVFGGLWLLGPQSPFQHPKKVDQRTAATNSACIMRAVADGFTTSTEYGVEQGNCAQASVGTGSCVHIRTSYLIERCSHAKFGSRNSSGPHARPLPAAAVRHWGVAEKGCCHIPSRGGGWRLDFHAAQETKPINYNPLPRGNSWQI